MLERLAAEGLTKMRISLKLKRTEQAVMGRAKQLGITIKRKERFRFDPRGQ